MTLGASTVFEVGDQHTLTVITSEELHEGKVFRSAGNVPEQEAVYWEVMSISDPANAICECKVVGINAYMRTIM